MSRVFFAECRNYQPAEVSAGLQKIFSRPEISRIFRSGERVLVKPNFLIPAEDEAAVTTHSAVVFGLCRILRDLGCSVGVGESPGMGSLTACLSRQGLTEPLKKLGVRVVEFTAPRPAFLPNGRIVKSVPLAAEIAEFDAVVSAAKLKTHCQCYFTGAVKNLYGCLPGTIKPEFHLRLPNAEMFSSFLLDVHDAVSPRLGIIDGIIGMEGEGPSGGVLKKAGFLAASADCPALDIEAIKAVSLDPQRALYLTERLARSAPEVIRLGRIDPVVFAPPGKMFSLEDTIPFPAPLRKLMKWLTIAVPVFRRPPVCRLCGNCVKICPGRPKALAIQNQRVVFQRRRCIRCYCCHEICPHKAVSLSRPLLMRFWRNLKIPNLRG